MSRRGERMEAVAWARAVMTDPSTVFLDTETTGLGGPAEVIDLALVAGDGTVLLDTLVRPKRPIPAAATRIHGLVDDHVRDAPDWCIVHARLSAALAGRRVVVYNAPFDWGIIAGCCESDGLALPAGPWECAMRAYARYRAEPGGWGGSPRWHKLTDACHAFGIPPGGHRALADALACRAVVAGMATSPYNRS
ncbi:MAG: 3'-5' exonuclease [Thermomicrobiales bacterium]